MEAATSRHQTIAAIVNPAAGRGRSRARWRRVRRALEEAGVGCEAFETEGRGDATRLTQRALAAGFQTLLAVGGDGTLHEVINGLRCNGTVRDDVRLCCVPAGTGMDFARNLAFPRRPARVVDRILRGAERRIDVGLARSAGDHVFINFAETGLGAEVVARAAVLSPRLPGRSAFFVSALGAALRESNRMVTVTVDGQLLYRGPLVSVVAANGRYFGGGMKIAPYARVDDGELDILILGDFTRAEMMSQIWKIYPGAHLTHDKVLWARGRQVRVDAEEHRQLDLDGELVAGGSCTLSVLPRALRVIS